MGIKVGQFCDLLNEDDVICLVKPDGGFASGMVKEMKDYFDEEIIHLSANRSPIAYRKNNCILYNLDIK